MEDGSFPLGTTAFEKRGIAVMLPEWQMEKCIQCGRCSYVCPHATIRTILINDEELKNAPESFKVLKAAGKGLENLHFRVQIAPLDCTGCSNCADVCPVKEKAIVMKPADQGIIEESENWEYALKVSYKDGVMDPYTLKGSQFSKPLLEFNGACPGCGETPYVRLLTQLFGDRMMIANATGCSSIWGASAPSIAYTTNAEGKGPAWANSLFEDNAEYGYGMYLGVKQIREKLAELMEQAVNSPISDKLKEAFKEWLDGMNNGSKSKAAASKIFEALKDYDYKGNKAIEEIAEKKDFLVKRSFWILGGDGWAYDIGYGGVDHVLASGDDVNLFVMDTEVYSNTEASRQSQLQLLPLQNLLHQVKKSEKKTLV
jgi:pyruvate-ferredoxin/flavodoxin oxidoreductase